jgi:transposase-like protein
MSSRAVPNLCPYCGDEDLRPHVPEDAPEGSAGHGTWECHSCLRAFKLTMIGQLRRPATVGAPR